MVKSRALGIEQIGLVRGAENRGVDQKELWRLCSHGGNGHLTIITQLINCTYDREEQIWLHITSIPFTLTFVLHCLCLVMLALNLL